jgi:hypothetical protein
MQNCKEKIENTLEKQPQWVSKKMINPYFKGVDVKTIIIKILN